MPHKFNIFCTNQPRTSSSYLLLMVRVEISWSVSSSLWRPGKLIELMRNCCGFYNYIITIILLFISRNCFSTFERHCWRMALQGRPLFHFHWRDTAYGDYSFHCVVFALKAGESYVGVNCYWWLHDIPGSEVILEY